MNDLLVKYTQWNVISRLIHISELDKCTNPIARALLTNLPGCSGIFIDMLKAQLENDVENVIFILIGGLVRDENYSGVGVGSGGLVVVGVDMKIWSRCSSQKILNKLFI